MATHEDWPAANDKLTKRQRAFVEEYLIDLNGAQAAIRAGYSARTARQIAEENLTKPDISAAIAAAMKARSERTGITADQVLERWWAIVNADVNDIIQFRRTACRYCHGVEHAYQWIDQREFNRAMSDYYSTLADGKAVVDVASAMAAAPADVGGYGFSSRLEPVDTCPHCFGEGAGEVHALDTRKLAGPAKHLFAGVKVTQSGFEIKMHDKMKALESVARHLGMFIDKVEHTVVDRAAMLAAARERSHVGKR